MGIDRAAGEKRRYYRICYPQSLRARLSCAGRSMAIIDICEGGIRCVHESSATDLTGALLNGTVHFRCGDTTEVSGHVIRVSGRELTVNLDRGISFNAILREQRALRGRRIHLV